MNLKQHTTLIFVTAVLVVTGWGTGCGDDGATGSQTGDSTQDIANLDGISAVDAVGETDTALDTGCVADCSKKQCGDDGCGGSCGTCDAAATCSAIGVCEAICTPNCVNKNCGPNGCGGLCGQCDDGQSCDLGVCVGGPEPDCDGKQCGPDGIGGSCGQCDAGFECNAAGQCSALCVPDCDGKVCGDDGCSGNCGECEGGTECTEGQCIPVCVPNCEGKGCGSDGCSGSCGECLATQTCSEAGQCETVCVPDCDNKVCGDDGCGATCGSCEGSAECTEGQCVTPCEPDCGGNVCGDDGCGGECGVCKGNATCEEGQCKCVPNCTDKECGTNGCGGLCGLCPAGQLCLGSGQCSGAAGPQTCPEVLTCMMVQGCGCQEGSNCPKDFDAITACVAICEQDPMCASKCMGSATPTAQNNAAGFLSCINNTCEANVLPSDCIDGVCLNSYATCYALGDKNCSETIDCTVECTDSACASACASTANSSGLAGLLEANVCAADLCAGSSNLSYCENVALLGVCRLEKPACAPVGAGTGSCVDVVLCLADCPIGDDQCRLDCVSGMGQPATTGVATMVGCIIDECLADMTPACLQTAVSSGACALAWEQCSTCDVTAKQNFGPAFVVTQMAIGASGHPGEALNIDPDKGVGDCAPQNNCSGGLDNGLAAFGPFLNPSLSDSIASGALILVGDLLGDTKGTFSIPIYTAFDVVDDCNPAIQSCEYHAATFSFDEACMPLVQFDGCTLVGNKLTGGGDDTQIPLPLPVTDETFLIVTLYRARIVGDATVTGSGVQLKNTIVGGAIRKTDLVIAINSIPGDTLAGIPKSLVLTLVNGVSADVDTDGDNTNDAISVGLKVTGEFGKIVGVK